MVSDLSSMKVFHHKVKSLFILEALNLLHDEWIISLFKNFFFLDYLIQRSILQYEIFKDNFQSVQHFGVVFLDSQVNFRVMIMKFITNLKVTQTNLRICSFQVVIIQFLAVSILEMLILICIDSVFQSAENTTSLIIISRGGNESFKLFCSFGLFGFSRLDLWFTSLSGILIQRALLFSWIRSLLILLTAVTHCLNYIYICYIFNRKNDYNF